MVSSRATALDVLVVAIIEALFPTQQKKEIAYRWTGRILDLYIIGISTLYNFTEEVQWVVMLEEEEKVSAMTDMANFFLLPN